MPYSRWVGPVVTAEGTRFALLLSHGHRADCGACRLGCPCLVGYHLRLTASANVAALNLEFLKAKRAAR